MAETITRDYPEIKTVGILDTTGTMKGGLFQKRLGQGKIKTLAPDDAVQSTIMAAIYDIKNICNLIEGCCNHAAGFAEGLKAAGYQVLNEVVLNQVLVKFGSDEQTRRVIRHIQQDGTCWCGETKWHGHVAMRISVSSWTTTAEDVSQSLAAIIRISNKETGV